MDTSDQNSAGLSSSQKTNATVIGASGPSRWIGIGSVVVVLAVWTIGTNIGVIKGTVIPTPQVLLESTWEFITEGYQRKSFIDHVSHSVFRAMAGLGFGVLCGVPVGLLMGYYPLLNSALSPFFAFLRPIPTLAFVPLVVLNLGIGELSKIVVIWLAAFLYMALYSNTGVHNVSRDFILLGRNLALSRWRMFRSIILPASLPYIFAGLKTATALSWMIVVAAELIAAQSGLGYMIMDASTFFNLPFVCVGILFIGGIGLVLEYITTYLERRFLHWSGR